MQVMVFGVFDRLHPGHLYFLYHARLKGDELIAVVARDSAVKKLKKHAPMQSESTRASRVRGTKLSTKTILGDKEQGKHTAIKRYKPDIIALGYDQGALEEHLREFMREGKIPKAKLVKIRAFKPKEYHSSILAI